MKKVVSFLADKCVAYTTQYGVLVLELRGDGHYIRLQKTTRTGVAVFGNIHFECDGQGWGAYDVVHTCKYRSNLLSITLIESADEEFDGRLRYEIELHLSVDDLRQCRDFLTKILSGTAILKHEP